MRGAPVYVGSDFSGGLNTRDGAFELGFNQARDLLNVVGTTGGAVRKRDGLVTFASPAVSLLSATPVDLGAARYLVAQGATAFYRVDTGGAVTTITGTTTPTSGVRWQGVQAPAIGGQGPLWLMNGTDTPQQWTGTGNVADWTASSGTLPNGQFMRFIGNRVFAAGMGSYGGVSDPGSTLVWSDIGNPRSWPAQNIVELDPNDGDQITGLGTFGPRLIVFKRRKTFVITNLDTGANQRISADTGCVAARSVVEAPGATYFLTLDKGVYETNGSSMQPMSDIIRPTLTGIVESLRSVAAAAFFNNHYYLAVALNGGAAANDTLLDYDVLQKSWWKHSVASTQLVVWRPVSDAQLHSLNASAARVDHCFVAGQSADIGAAFLAYHTGPWINPTYFRRRIINFDTTRQRLRQIRFNASGALSLYMGRDFSTALAKVADYNFLGTPTTFGGTGSFGGTGTFGDPSATQPARANNLGVNRVYSIQWSSNSTSPWQLEDYVPIHGPRAN